ncbi:hypothetical protein GCM10009839_59140 [Catenulispora yoronensis]|uniref:TnsA-like heteromeric transposase endonuclease subunit n=2 Tax=Catenulispora yoronensis TaxID=450799 RepID=A0ABN2V5L2_9ACTN
MLLDFDRTIAAFSSQPFWLSWHDGRRLRRHAPDYFARRVDGVGVVIDVRADDRIEDRDREAFEATESACRSVGWEFRRVGTLPAVLAANVRWLARYRHPRCRNEDAADALSAVFARPTPLMEGAARAGDTLGVLPVLFHLMWEQVLRADLSQQLLGPGSVVWSGASR